ncbi:Crp/Fnr family transcriptional regulator [Lentzea sp. NPDC102401]|uniref:Crp/Fnr family transcriptional regulator n=1 Tax=Lentzea sp. NPDC102401 TaxID=3364128 RepID=UPI003821C515
MSDPDLTDLAVRCGEEVTYRQRHVIFTRGSWGDRLYIIRSGKVKITVSASETVQEGARRSDMEKLLALHGPSDVFGEAEVFAPGPRASTATAVTGVRVVSIDRDALLGRIRVTPALAESMLGMLARQVRRADAECTDLVLNDVPGRAAKALLELATRFGYPEGGALRVVHDLAQEELAHYVGATRQATGEALSSFARRGWLRVDGRSVLILDSDRLQRRGR